MDRIAAQLATLATHAQNTTDTEDGSVSLEQAAITAGVVILAGLVIVGIKALVPTFLSGIQVPGL